MSISFFSLYKKLADREVKITAELKNGLSVAGNLCSVDSNMNMYLQNIECPAPQFQNSSSCFIRGNNVKTLSINMDPLQLDEILHRVMEQAN